MSETVLFAQASKMIQKDSQRSERPRKESLKHGNTQASS